MTTARAWRGLLELARTAQIGSGRRGAGDAARLLRQRGIARVRDEKMGSSCHASGLAERGGKSSRLLSLETIGLVQRRTGQPALPVPLQLLLPPPAIFIGFVANPRSRNLLHRVIGSFSRTRLSLEAQWAGIDRRGQLVASGALLDFGWPAVMVTDTALSATRIPTRCATRRTKLDYDGLARGGAGPRGRVRDSS